MIVDFPVHTSLFSIELISVRSNITSILTVIKTGLHRLKLKCKKRIQKYHENTCSVLFYVNKKGTDLRKFT